MSEHICCVCGHAVVGMCVYVRVVVPSLGFRVRPYHVNRCMSLVELGWSGFMCERRLTAIHRVEHIVYHQ